MRGDAVLGVAHEVRPDAVLLNLDLPDDEGLTVGETTTVEFSDLTNDSRANIALKVRAPALRPVTRFGKSDSAAMIGY